MSMEFVPHINREKSINLLLASMASVEFGLADIIKAEAEKIQAALASHQHHHERIDIEELLKINKSAGQMLEKVIAKEILLGLQLKDLIELIEMPEEDGEE